MKLLCPGCEQSTDVPEGARPGDTIECAMCAGLKFRITRSGGSYKLAPVHLVSCPVCEARIEVPDNSAPGGRLRCCGREFKLTFEYGAWALQPLE